MRPRIVVTLGLLWAALAPAAAGASGWAIQPTRNPSGTQYSALASVSCPAPRNCVAVGSYSTSGGRFSPSLTLVERWNGSKWEIEPTPNPAGAVSSRLDGVSCATPKDCTAVGSYYTQDGGGFTLAEHWNGSTWEIQPTPNAPVLGYPPPASFLLGVSCTTVDHCTAVGEEGGPNGIQPFVEHWNGSVWKIQASPAPRSDRRGLVGVSCATASDCVAVGFNFSFEARGTMALVERWDGSTWEIQNSPQAGANSELGGVSCTSSRDCVAVGSYFANCTSACVDFPLAERWTGSTWEIEPTPAPAGAVSSGLSGVSCKTPHDCTAVGSYSTDDGSRIFTLAERWDGSIWQIDPTPNPAGSSDSFLSSASCPGPGSCAAVGGAGSDVDHVETLAEGFSAGP